MTAATVDDETLAIVQPFPSPETTRRPGVEGFPTLLSDGRFWLLACPRRYLVPSFEPIQADENGYHRQGLSRCILGEKWDYPHPARRKVGALLDTIQEGGTIPLVMIVDVALEMLILCHEVPEDLALELLCLSPAEIEDLLVSMLRAFRGETTDGTDPETSEKAD